MYRVYIVDDEPLMIESMVRTVQWAESGFEVIGTNTSSVDGAAEILSMKPELVFCDLKMPDMDGIAMMKHLLEHGAECEFIMLSAFGEFEASRRFFRLDGFDYLLKPLASQEAELALEQVSRRLAKKHNLVPSTVFTQTQTGPFDELITYVTENFNKKHTLSALSHRFNISPSHICGLFSKHYGSTLTIFLTNLRMDAAVKMLADTDKVLKEIAIDCGYSDYFYFCRVFKAHFETSPTEYRQRLADCDSL